MPQNYCFLFIPSLMSHHQLFNGNLKGYVFQETGVVFTSQLFCVQCWVDMFVAISVHRKSEIKCNCAV